MAEHWQTGSPTTRMTGHINGVVHTAAIHAAARFGIADALMDGPKALEDLALETGTDGRALARLLHLLALAGIFAALPDGRFTNTPLSETLLRDAPASLRTRALRTGATWWMSAWARLDHSLATGGSAFEHVHGQSFWDFLNADAEAAALFDTLRGTTADQGEIVTVLDAYDFSGFASFVDIGAGHGGLTAALLAAHAGMTGTWFDLPHAEPGARQTLTAHGVAERCHFMPGSFLEGIPGGRELLVVKDVVHNWSREGVLRLLAHCRAAMDDHARLLIIDGFLTADSPELLRSRDVTMLVLFGTGYWQQAEMLDLLQTVGLRPSRVVPTRSPAITLIEAIVESDSGRDNPGGRS